MYTSFISQLSACCISQPAQNLLAWTAEYVQGYLFSLASAQWRHQNLRDGKAFRTFLASVFGMANIHMQQDCQDFRMMHHTRSSCSAHL
jgi:hypothetical protein